MTENQSMRCTWKAISCGRAILKHQRYQETDMKSSILFFLKLDDASSEDKISRIKAMPNLIQEKLLALYLPAKQLDIDESMIGFKGKYSLKQYISNKTIKLGFERICYVNLVQATV